MLTDSKLRSQVDSLWLKLASGGLTNPLDAIEQFSYLLFLKQLEDQENIAEKRAKMRGEKFKARIPKEMRWSHWSNFEAAKALKFLKDEVFPWFTTLGKDKSSFAQYMQNAQCKINQPSLLIEACRAIEAMQISQQNQDVQGDLYEYLLSRLSTSGYNGQFRTPRHIIRMMVQMMKPKPRERIGDLAAGTCGFLVNAYQYILESHTSPEILTYDEDGFPHNLIGDKLAKEDAKALQSPKAFRGYDNDSGMTMLRIGSMNMILHGIQSPQFFYNDTLSKEFEESKDYDLILMNPPFKGAINKNNVNGTLPDTTTKTELLFLHLILRALDMGGRSAVIVPDGVLFGSSNAHVETRKKIIEENRLDGVISMPSGVFKPYAGVSTAVLILTRGGKTENIWFYDMEHDGFSLDDKRVKVEENDIPDILECWNNRSNKKFIESREKRIVELRKELAPLKDTRLKLQADVNRLTFEQALDGNGKNMAKLAEANAQLSNLQSQISNPQSELDRLTRQFWVTKDQVKANKYDLSASRYRQVDADAVYHEKPSVTLERLARLEQVMLDEIKELRDFLK